MFRCSERVDRGGSGFLQSKKMCFFFFTEMETQREGRRQNPIVQSLSCNNLTKLKTKMLCEVLLRIDNIHSLLLL